MSVMNILDEIGFDLASFAEGAGKLADDFEEMSLTRKGIVKFPCCVPQKQSCGTVACHAGWYAVHACATKGITIAVAPPTFASGNFRIYVSDRGRDIDFFDGILAIAKVLFPDWTPQAEAAWEYAVSAINRVFTSYPDLWIEGDPRAMFSTKGSVAFGLPEEEIGLKEIADQWRRVSNRAWDIVGAEMRMAAG